MKKLFVLFILSMLIPLPTHATKQGGANLFDFQDKSRWLVRARVVKVGPDEESTTSIGGAVTADSATVPELDFTYFFTKNIAVELILAVTTHDMGAKNTALGTLSLGDVWLLPPTLTMQYHFDASEKCKPYIGAGINYTVFFNEDSGDVASIDYSNEFGYALQAGFDYWVDKDWGINLDVKKLYLNTDVKINGGAVRADVDLDPWLFGAGVVFRF